MAKTKTKKKEHVELVPLQIRVESLRKGDKIVTKLGGRRQQDIEREMKLFVEGKGPWPSEGKIVQAFSEVKTIDICEGKWRTHVHINTTDCYDLRCSVNIAVPKEQGDDA
jgi:hypothetical protein